MLSLYDYLIYLFFLEKSRNQWTKFHEINIQDDASARA